jgi:hypothetical protein
MLARRFAGPSSRRAARRGGRAFACARFALDTIVLDDGFQHRALARDADLVLVADDGAGAWPLPAVRCASRRALGRARAVLAVDGAPPPAPDGRGFRGQRSGPTALVEAEDLGRARPSTRSRGDRASPVAGIARSEPLRRDAPPGRGRRRRAVLAFPTIIVRRGATRAASRRARRPPRRHDREGPREARAPAIRGLSRAPRSTLEVDESDALVALLMRR